MSVRIIAGKWKGRKIPTPEGYDTTRPLTDRIKQSLFDRLGQFLDGQTVCDICAGSGSFGFEAASRGASAVHLIEADRRVADLLTGTKALLGNNHADDVAGITIHPRPFQQVLASLKQSCDVVYADPPFPWFQSHPNYLRELVTLGQATCSSTGQFLIRGERGYNLPPDCPPPNDTWQYGRSWIAVYG